MNKQLRKNIDIILKINKNLKIDYIYERVKNIKWDINKIAKTTEVTLNFNCNTRCKFCYFKPDDFKKTNTTQIKEISKTFYNGIKKGEWISVIIGGEPTLSKDIFRVGMIAQKIGYPCVKICTNGVLLTKKLTEKLKKCGYNMFDISIHSPKEETHDFLVGIKGAFKKVMKACSNVKKLNLELGTNIVINKINYKEFKEFIDLTYNKLGINYYNIIFGHLRGIMQINKNILKIRYSDVIEYIKNGLEIIRKTGMPLFARILVNFPPCILPEYINIIADWENDIENSSTLILPGKKTINMSKMKNLQSLKTKKCKKCILYTKCRGIDREYLDEFGSSEFIPLKKIPSQIFRTTFEI